MLKLIAKKNLIIYNTSMELQLVSNFINGRFLLSNSRVDKKELFTNSVISTYSVDVLGTYRIEKVYYDTRDFYFAEKGINIYTVSDGVSKELVIRYDSEQVQRIEFLKNTPSFYTLTIFPNSHIIQYIDQITSAIYKVFPSGLHVNIEEMIRACVPVVKIQKRREGYRVVNNRGLKMTFYFDTNLYNSMLTGSKFSQESLDVVCDSYQTKDDFTNFLRQFVLDYPKLIKIDSNELAYARKNL